MNSKKKAEVLYDFLDTMGHSDVRIYELTLDSKCFDAVCEELDLDKLKLDNFVWSVKAGTVLVKRG